MDKWVWEEATYQTERKGMADWKWVKIHQPIKSVESGCHIIG